ncbi:MAG: cytochrome c [Anaerolineae bacterium]|nr:cytochrome c [Anaerolineae bacterium]
MSKLKNLLSLQMSTYTAPLWLMLLFFSLTAQTTPTPTLEPSPTPRPVDLTCDLLELQQKQAELAVALGSFDSDAESNPGAALDNLFKVGAAYQELALSCGYIPADIATRFIGTDVERILSTLGEVFGDPINGQVLYNGELGCSGCHSADTNVAPPTEGTYTRILDERLHDPLLPDYTPEHYLIESIVLPGNYVVEGYTNVMPNNFSERLTLQDLADLIAYLESQDGASPE